MKPISCIIPSRDRADLLPRAIDSVISQNDGDAVEIVVVDDGSVDATAAVLARHYPRVRYLRTCGIGAAAARNRGAAVARGEIFMFLDSDDRWLPGHVRRLRQGIDNGDVVFGVTRNIDETGGGTFLVPEAGEQGGGDCLSRLCRWCFIMTSAVAVRRWVFSACDGFPEEMGSLGEDWGFFIRLALRVEFNFAGPDPVSERFLHPGSICARVSRDEFSAMYRNLALVVGNKKGKDEDSFARQLAWLDDIEENICLSVQQWYRLMAGAGMIHP